jgi:hypothetical protein
MAHTAVAVVVVVSVAGWLVLLPATDFSPIVLGAGLLALLRVLD